ncbi:bleomycin hydrolase [Octopus bimaculoides]|uniref:bleomycin hydrolase n=1 Tax=Octopus bimaculoides TaxID=37653 RepID=UPI0022E856A4|nr:bleomycin hydrolase [Octopus bimaculoides]
MFTQGVCNHVNINEISRCPRQLLDVNHVFSVKVEEAKPVTHQRASGRCWIFAALNQMRIPFMEKFEVPEFEFSQAYLFFWDKLERSNFILDAFIDCARNGNTAGSRVVDHLLVNASDDGGQWDMLVNLISKYGIVPKNIFPDTVSCEASRYLVSIISHKVCIGNKLSCLSLCMYTGWSQKVPGLVIYNSKNEILFLHLGPLYLSLYSFTLLLVSLI